MNPTDASSLLAAAHTLALSVWPIGSPSEWQLELPERRRGRRRRWARREPEPRE
jgi:hypothetical protein